MSPTLQEELKQNRPFRSPEEEAAVSVIRTAALLERAIAQTFRPHGITATQYNVLRILRGAGDAGLCRNEVGQRLIREVPDVTRLLDRMEQLDLIQRTRGGVDRRYVTTRITAKGLQLAADLDDAVAETNQRLLGHLGADLLTQLTALLQRVRDAL